MVAHLRHRWGLRLALVVLAPLLAWSQWPGEATGAGAGQAMFLALWTVAAVVAALGHTFPGWRGHAPGTRSSRLPVALQGLLLGLVFGAFLVLLAGGEAPASSVGLLLAVIAASLDAPRQASSSTSTST